MKSRCTAVSQYTMQYHTIYINVHLFLFSVFFVVFYFILTVRLSFPSNIIQDMSLHSALLFNTPTSTLSGSAQQTYNEPGQICCTFFLHSTLLFNTSSLTCTLSGSAQQTYNEAGQSAPLHLYAATHFCILWTSYYAIIYEGL